MLSSQLTQTGTSVASLCWWRDSRLCSPLWSEEKGDEENLRKRRIKLNTLCELCDRKKCALSLCAANNECSFVASPGLQCHRALTIEHIIRGVRNWSRKTVTEFILNREVWLFFFCLWERSEEISFGAICCRKLLRSSVDGFFFSLALSTVSKVLFFSYCFLLISCRILFVGHNTA